MHIQEISSLQNPRIKELVHLLEKSRERRRQGLMVVEGLREISLALQSGVQPQAIFFCGRRTAPEQLQPLLARGGSMPLFDLKEEVFAKIAYRDGVANAVLLGKSPETSLAQFRPRNGRIILIEGVEKPGNLGAVFRSADASGCGGIVVCDPAADLFNPNVLRSSLGCVFAVPAAVCTAEELLPWLQAEQYRLITTYMDSPGGWTELDLRGKTAVALGTEAVGLSDIWRDVAAANLRIPMKGLIDSLNVSNAAAVIMYELQRQQDASHA